MRCRLAPVVFVVLAPFIFAAGRRALASVLFVGRIAPSASVGISFIDTDYLELGPQSRIGHFSIFRNLDSLIIERGARIGTFNWVFGARRTSHFEGNPDRKSWLVLREGASVTSRHILDCTDRIEIGKFATAAGFRSQFLTHSINVISNRQECAPVLVGEFSFIGTGVTILKGARFPARSVLAAGSVFSAKSGDEFWIYSGIPARPAKRLPDDALYMQREMPTVR